MWPGDHALETPGRDFPGCPDVEGHTHWPDTWTDGRQVAECNPSVAEGGSNLETSYMLAKKKMKKL